MFVRFSETIATFCSLFGEKKSKQNEKHRCVLLKRRQRKKGGIWIFSFFSHKILLPTPYGSLKEEVMLEFSTSCRKVHYSSCCQIPRLRVSHPVMHIDIGILNQFFKVGRSEINSSKHALTLDGGHLGN